MINQNSRDQVSAIREAGENHSPESTTYPPSRKSLHIMIKPMFTDSQLPWILIGYKTFALSGPDALSVEGLAREVGKSKSSFYHHFADLDIFISFLLEYHLQRASIIAEEERKCQNIDPELLEVLVAFREDLLFNRRLRVHRDQPRYATCFQTSSMEVGEAIIGIWSEALGLQGNSHLAMMVMQLTLENFYLQITEETLTLPLAQTLFSATEEHGPGFSACRFSSC